jgi:hypothetical protein
MIIKRTNQGLQVTLNTTNYICTLDNSIKYGFCVILFIYIFWLWGLQFFLKPGIWINTGIAHMVCLFLFSLVILCSHLKRKNIIFYKLIFKFFINLLFIFVFCHHNGFWCYTHPDHKKILCQKLISLGTELTKQNILWSLDGGSALGALREYPKNNFGILYEKDEDIIINSNQKEEFQNKNFNLPNFDQSSWFVHAAEMGISIHFLNFNKTKKIEYCNSSEMYVREDIHALLKFYYGSDYMIPQKNSARIGINRAIGCAIVVDSWILFQPWDKYFCRIFFFLFFIHTIFTVPKIQISKTYNSPNFSEEIEFLPKTN